MTDLTRTLVRRATSWMRPLPDAIVVGAMKAGSTSAYALMLEHPLVRGPGGKEVHFLDRHFERGESWYRSHFPAALPGRDWVAVESTPYYLSFPLAPARLAELVPDVRLVVLLRDPVERAVSQWKQRSAEGRETRTLAAVLEEERSLPDEVTVAPGFDTERHRRQILVHGHYAIQLRRWLAAFGRDQILIVDSRDLFSEPQATMGRVFGFLGLDAVAVHDVSPRNVGDQRRIDPSTRAALGAYYRPFNEELFELLGTRFEWEGVDDPT